uniref:Uncharacterized protein n=1 Tax=Romanomermis culicivorax TaxID=13658 RepID=A0A915I8Z1_ROMCU
MVQWKISAIDQGANEKAQMESALTCGYKLGLQTFKSYKPFSRSVSLMTWLDKICLARFLCKLVRVTGRWLQSLGTDLQTGEHGKA